MTSDKCFTVLHLCRAAVVSPYFFIKKLTTFFRPLQSDDLFSCLSSQLPPSDVFLNQPLKNYFSRVSPARMVWPGRSPPLVTPLQGGLSHEPNVRLCVCQTRELYVTKRNKRILILYKRLIHLVFTALHGMQSRYSDGNSVCPSVYPSVRPSVCLSVKRVNCTWQNEINVFLYCTKDWFIWHKEWLVGNDSLYLKFCAKLSLFHRKHSFPIDFRS